MNKRKAVETIATVNDQSGFEQRCNELAKQGYKMFYANISAHGTEQVDIYRLAIFAMDDVRNNITLGVYYPHDGAEGIPVTVHRIGYSYDEHLSSATVVVETPTGQLLEVEVSKVVITR